MRGWMVMMGAAIAAAPVAAAGTGDQRPALVATIEIPAGGDVKYEQDAQGRIVVDRFLPLPLVYPANYGSLDGTEAGDGDPLDVLVHARAPILPGARVAVRPVGVLRMTDDGEADDKIVAVPVSSVDPGYDAVRTPADLPGGEAGRLEAFFRLYKQDGSGRSPVILSGFGDADEAQRIVDAALARAAGRQ